MNLTGGPLNNLNGKYGISAPNKSVPIMKLIKAHHPKSKEELVELIDFHFKNKCKCGVVSKGTIENFGKNLYDAQIKEWKEYRFELKECINWEYNLFIIQSLKGNLIEQKAKELLIHKFFDLEIFDAEGYLDEEIRIDLEVKKNGNTILGIQVKPSSYNFVRKNVQSMNLYRNSLAGFEVFYLYYDYKSEKFINLDEMCIKIKELI